MRNYLCKENERQSDTSFQSKLQPGWLSLRVQRVLQVPPAVWCEVPHHRYCLLYIEKNANSDAKDPSGIVCADI